ncbi:MAG: ferredoxin--nitrite reductase [Myxococcota bacterium]
MPDDLGAPPPARAARSEAVRAPLRNPPLNRVEQLKRDKSPLGILDDIYRWAHEGFESIPPEDYDLLKWHGLFHRKQTPGFFMLRLRISNGALNTTQVRTIAELMRDIGRGTGDLTTRQNIQLRWLTIEDVPVVLERLHAVGLGSEQTGMDNFRNVVGCPAFGLHEHELIDTHQITTATALSLLGYDFENIPRKLNISINGCRYDCTHARTNDIGMTPATRRIGSGEVVGFNVVVGGHMGSRAPHLARSLDAFVRPMHVPALCRAIMTVFRDHGDRSDRKKARMWYLIERMGVERFRAAVMRAFGEDLPGAGTDQLYEDPDPRQQDHLGVHVQKQPGLSYVGVVVPTGRVTADRLFALADIADRYGSREIRLTHDQNIIIPNVSNDSLARLQSEPLLQVWSPAPSGILRGLVTCTGKDYCHFALNDTKGISLRVVRALEERFPGNDKLVRLNVSGCVHGCARHRSTELGLQSARIRREGEIVDGFDVFAGGSSAGAGAREPQLAQMVGSKQTIEQAVDVLATVISKKYQSEGNSHTMDDDRVGECVDPP